MCSFLFREMRIADGKRSRVPSVWRRLWEFVRLSGSYRVSAARTLLQKEIWCQRRDSNSQTPVSKTGCYSNSHTLALWCTGEDLTLRVPLGETGLQPVRFGRAHAPVQTWRKVDESNAHRSSRCPGFQDQLPAIQQYLPLAESTGVEAVSLLRE